jgi:hypothetical protein
MKTVTPTPYQATCLSIPEFWTRRGLRRARNSNHSRTQAKGRQQWDDPTNSRFGTLTFRRA